MLPYADIVRHGTLLLLLVVCAYTDLARGRIYNVVVYPAMLVALVLGTRADPHTAHPLIDTLLRGLGVAAVFYVVYLMGGVHGGDVKFMAAVGALAPNPDSAIRALVLTSVVGCIIGVALLVWHGRLWQGLRQSVGFLFSFGRRKPQVETGGVVLTMPYGVAIALGTMWAWLFYNWAVYYA